MERPSWAPPDVDVDRPSVARVYDYQLGGSHNFAVDREAAERVIALMPGLPALLRANRAFLRRAVRTLVGAGVRQFLDLGSGIPTAGNVHEIAQKADPDSRVVYVDIDPVAVAHSRALLAGNEGAMVVHGDLRRPDTILADPTVTGLLDLSEPVAVLMVAVLHFVSDADRPVDIVRRYRDISVPGSYLVLSHAARDESVDRAAAEYAQTVNDFWLRGPDEVNALLAGYELLPPGLTSVTRWRPDPGTEPEPIPQLCAVGRKP
ncbi:MAG: SAM-dependent methyltransferase [Mycobacteriales bacterium]